MTSSTSHNTETFSSSTRTAFLDHVRQNPNNRRVSKADEETIIEWLTNPSKRPSSQQEFSRRNYVRKTFVWDENTKRLLAASKNGEDRRRMVIIDDLIVDVVESAHLQNGHLGWDATWRDVSTSYYGILRSDVIFLLKKCQLCARDPLKYPKGASSNSRPQSFDPEATQANSHDTQYGDEDWESVDNNEGSFC
jgi:hypothetical protein